jgi:cytochrome c peroxidase
MLGFTAEEVERIATHGPWPPPPVRDAGNPLAGRPAAVAFGQRLFTDPRLSPAGVACAACHDPARAFTDGRARSVGVSEVDRNAPSLLNAVHERWLGWGGESDSLWSQALRTLLDPREMASSAGHVGGTVRGDPALASAWRAAIGQDPATVDDETLLVGVAQALGAWNATLVSARTPFDDFRDALLRGDRATAAAYPLAAQRGLRLFVGRGNCQVCHHGPRFSHGEFADIGARFFVRPGVVDPGRHAGVQALRTGRYHLLSRWSEATPAESAKTRHVEATHRHFGEFKVPSLRHVAQTAPYLHDGQLPTLKAVVRHYSVLDVERLHGDGEQILRPLRLTPQEEEDLVAFLETLSPR